VTIPYHITYLNRSTSLKL